MKLQYLPKTFLLILMHFDPPDKVMALALTVVEGRGQNVASRCWSWKRGAYWTLREVVIWLVLTDHLLTGLCWWWRFSAWLVEFPGNCPACPNGKMTLEVASHTSFIQLPIDQTHIRCFDQMHKCGQKLTDVDVTKWYLCLFFSN